MKTKAAFESMKEENLIKSTLGFIATSFPKKVKVYQNL